MSLPTNISLIGTTISQGLAAISTGTATGRISVGASSFVADAQSSESMPDTESASALASLEFDFSRQNISGSSGFRITIRDVNSDTANWYNTSDVSATLTSTPVTIYENTNAVPTEIKMDWSIVVDNAIGTGTIEKSAGTAVDDTWSSVGSDGSFIDATFTAEALAGPGDSSEMTGTVTVNFWGRASGYADTLLATFSIDLEAIAESVDGLSPLSANNA